MVIEKIEINIPGISIHVPPEFPYSLKDNIYSVASAWKVKESTDDTTEIISENGGYSIYSDLKHTRATCQRPYGTSLESLRSIVYAVKKVGIFSGRMDTTEKLAKIDCEAKITFDALFQEFDDPKYDLFCLKIEESQQTIVGFGGIVNKLIKQHNFQLSEEKRKRFSSGGNIHKFIERYKFDYRRIFRF